MQIGLAARRSLVWLVAGPATTLIFALVLYASPLPAAAQVVPDSLGVLPKPEPFPTPAPNVTVMRSSQGDVRIFHRDGWTRRESEFNGSPSIHMTGPGGHDYHVSLAADGAPKSMYLGYENAETAKGSRTGATDTALGERCEIWASKPPFEERVYGGPMLACITDDGVTLWTGRHPLGAKEPSIYSRAVSVERRTPAWTEFGFPRQALNWSYWSPRLVFPPDTAKPAYEVRFGEHVIRVRGDTRFESRPNGASIRGPNISIYYNAPGDPHGRFEISPGPNRPYPHPLTGGSEPMDREPLRISGERCDWHRVDRGVRWGIVGVCVTDDGIRLAELTDYNDDVDRPDKLEVATGFRRGAPEKALMTPPSNVFEPWIAALPS